MESTSILILEHDPNYLELLLNVLKTSDLDYTPIIVENREEYEDSLINLKPQIILSDYSLPSFDGFSAYKIKQDICPKTPFIIVSGTIGAENAVELIKKRITDYVLKENMYRVLPKIQCALKESMDHEQKWIVEEELKQSREQLQKIMDGSLDMICTLNEEGRFVEVSTASIHVLGYRPEELIGMNAWDLIFPGDLGKTIDMVSDVILKKRSSHFENRYIRKNGEVVPIFWTVLWAENEKLAYCVARDVSSIKKAEDEIAGQNEQIKNILESITDGFISVDKNWIVRYYNKEAEQLLVPREQIINKNLWEVFGNVISLKFYSEYHRVMNEGICSSFEEYYPGLKIWVGINAYPSKDGIAVLFRDISEKKRQEHVNTLEKQVLELYTRKGSLIEDIIELLFKGIQQIHPELICSIQKVTDGKLYNWGYSHLPQGFIEATEGEAIEMGQGTTGTAAFVRTANISADFIWKDRKTLATDHNLKACFAYPVCDSNQSVIGVFTIYLKTARLLTRPEGLTLERAKYILQHIIENHIAEMALRKSEGKYRDLFHLIPSPLWVYDPDTYRFLNVNEAAIRHYGYTKEEFLNMTIKDILPKDTLKNLQSTVEISKKNRPFFQGTFDHLKKNGKLINVLIQSNLITFGDKKARMVLATDITEKLKFEQTLELSEKRFKALVHEGSDLINIIDSEGNYIYASPASAAMVGLTLEQVIGKNAFGFIHDEDKEIITKSFSSIMRTKRVETLPFRFKDKNGEYRWLQSIWTNLLKDSAIQGIVVNSKDITESVNYIQAIEEQNSNLRDIAWIQSHVVRAPLARIIGLIDLINNYPNDEQSTSELLGYLLTSAHELDDVIRTIVKKSEQAENFQIEPVN